MSATPAALDATRCADLRRRFRSLYGESCRICRAPGRINRDLGSRSGINHVQIFEDRGVFMGASNPHPH